MKIESKICKFRKEEWLEEDSACPYVPENLINLIRYYKSYKAL